MLHDSNFLPSETAVKQLLKKEAERILNPLSKMGPSYDNKVEYLGNYQAGKSVAYDVNNYDHFHKLNNVSSGTILYPVRAEFAVAREEKIEKISMTFLCHEDNFGKFTCSWVSEEIVGEIQPRPSSGSNFGVGLLLGTVATIGISLAGVIAAMKKKPNKPT